MQRTLILVGVLALGGGAVWAEAPATCAPPRRALIPGGVEFVTRVVHVPPCLQERRVPIYAVVKEPIYGCRTVPQYGAVAAPIQATREEPIYEIRRTPICGMVDVPVYAQVCRTVMGLDFTSWREERMVPWLRVREEVPCGVRRERRVLGYKEEKVRVGTALRACKAGVRVERRFLGYGQEQTILGVREVRRIAGYRSETVVVYPARTESVTERFVRPGRWVTVSDAAVRPTALPSTEGVLTEAEFRAALAKPAAR